MKSIAGTIALALCLVSSIFSFQVAVPITKSQRAANNFHVLYDTTSDVQEILKADYPIFYKLVMSKNADVWKSLNTESSGGFTIFAPSDAAMESLGKKKLNQLLDDRNRETAEKIAAYHAVSEPVGAWKLLNSGGVRTIGGDVKVGKSKTGDFFGFGGKEDGGVLLNNGAKITQTREIDNCILHETDALLSPELLWRYMDQLRIL
jgi:uncharacterized surface protein with fasciclin (FAS1) repeats